MQKKVFFGMGILWRRYYMGSRVSVLLTVRQRFSGFLFLKRIRQQVIRPVLIAKRAGPTFDPICSDRGKPAVGRGGERAAMLHRQGDADPRWDTVQDKTAADILRCPDEPG